MPLSACPSRTELAAYTQGSASAEAMQTIEAHFKEGCPPCEGLLLELERKDHAFGQLLRRHPPSFHLSVATIADPAPGVAADSAAPAHRPIADEYEVLEEIARGGMGVVYKARQTKLNRVVALKMILNRQHASLQERVRFQIEAEAVAHLQHPNIVQVYEVGEHDGSPFLSLEFCAGGSLDKKLNHQPMPANQAAELLTTLARAIHHAHLQGVVHRDLKPANILLTKDGEPKISDFGLARQLDADSGQTQSGTIMGSPSYMAPEQASGQFHNAGPAADVYSLGALLYECLTGHPPFRGATVLETLEQVRTREPASLRAANPRIDRDLETICLKCLAKEPAQRYASAQDLAADLDCFRTGEPIAARRAALPERAYRWVRRHKVLTAAVVGLLVVTAWTLYMNAQLRSANSDKDRHATQAETEASKARVARELAEKEATNARTAQQLADTRLKTNKDQQHKHNIGVAWTFLQQRLTDAADVALGQVPDSHRGWEWQHLRHLVRQSPRIVATLAVHDWGVVAALTGSDGQTLISSGQDGRVIVWDTERVRPRYILHEGVEAAGRGTWLHALSRSDQDPDLAAQLDCFTSLAWLSEGKVCVGASLRGRLVAWDLTADPPTRRELLPRDPALSFNALAASSDGNHLLVGAVDGTLIRHQIQSARTTKRSLDGGAVAAIVALPSGHWIVGQEDGGVSLLDADAQSVDRAAVPAPVWALDSPKEGGVVTVACGTPRLLTFEVDPRANKLHRGESYLLPEIGNPAPKALHSVRIAADGHIAAGDDQGRFVLWRPSDPRPHWIVADQRTRWFKAEEMPGLPLPLRRRLPVLLWPGAPGVLLTGGPNTLIRRWDVPETEGVSSFSVGPEPVARFDPFEDDLLWVGTRDGDLQLWDSRKGTKRLELRAAHRGQIAGLDVDANGVVATGGADGVLRFWRRAGSGTNERLSEVRSLLCPDSRAIRSVSLSTDGKRVAVYTDHDWAHVWDVASRSLLGSVDLRRGTGKALRGLAVLSPSGTELAVTGPGQTLQRRHGTAFENAIDMTGDHAAGLGGTALIWNPADPNVMINGDTIGRLRWHPNELPSGWTNPRMTGDKPVAGLACTPDGARLAALALDGSLELIDLHTGVRLLTLLPLPIQKATAVLFDCKGERLAVLNEDGKVVIRETPSRPHPATARRVAGDWEAKLVLPRPDYPSRELLLQETNIALDDAGALWFFFVRPVERNTEADRLRLGPIFLGRLSGTGYEEASFGMCDSQMLDHALLPSAHEMLAVVRRKTGPVTGQSSLYRYRTDRHLPNKVEGEGEPFMRSANNGYCLTLLPDPGSNKPAALHFSHAGYDMYQTDWAKGLEQTERVGRHGDGTGLRVASSANRLHLLFHRYRFDGDPHPPVFATSTDGARYQEEDRAILDAADTDHTCMAVDPAGRAVVLYLRSQVRGGNQWVLARREKEGWQRSVFPEATFGASIRLSNLVCDRSGTVRFAFLDAELRRLNLASHSGSEWVVEQVWDSQDSEDVVRTSDAPNRLALRLDGADRPVIIIAACGSKSGWLRMFRREENKEHRSES